MSANPYASMLKHFSLLLWFMEGKKRERKMWLAFSSPFNCIWSMPQKSTYFVMRLAFYFPPYNSLLNQDLFFLFFLKGHKILFLQIPFLQWERKKIIYCPSYNSLLNQDFFFK